MRNGPGLSDDEEAKKWLLEAANAGYMDAASYLESEFGIILSLVGFPWEEDLTIVPSAYGLYLEFCGVVHRDGKYAVRFWGRNTARSERTVWVTHCEINGEPLGRAVCLTDFPAGKSRYGYFILDKEIRDSKWDVSLELEIGHNADDERDTCCVLNIGMEFASKKLTWTSSVPERYGAGRTVYLADDFADIIVCGGSGLRIDFRGVNLDGNEECEFVFRAENGFGRPLHFWAVDILIDGEDAGEGCLPIGELGPGCSGEMSFSIPDISPYDITFFSMVIEIDDEDDDELFDACSLSVRLDGGGKCSAVYRETESVPQSLLSEYVGSLRTAGSFYVRNREHNGIEIYFRRVPSEYVRYELRTSGWRWFKSKKCWYNRYNEENLRMAEMITGGMCGCK